MLRDDFIGTCLFLRGGVCSDPPLLCPIVSLPAILLYTATPNAPSAPQVGDVGIDSVTLYWTHTIPQLVTGYIVEVRPPGSPTFQTLTHVTDPYLAAEGVFTPDTEYAFRVLAKNSEGMSIPSGETIVRTLRSGGIKKKNRKPPPNTT